MVFGLSLWLLVTLPGEEGLNLTSDRGERGGGEEEEEGDEGLRRLRFRPDPTRPG